MSKARERAREALEQALAAFAAAKERFEALIAKRSAVYDELHRAEGRTRLGRDLEWVRRAAELRTEYGDAVRQVDATLATLGPLAQAVEHVKECYLARASANERAAVLGRCLQALTGG